MAAFVSINCSCALRANSIGLKGSVLRNCLLIIAPLGNGEGKGKGEEKEREKRRRRRERKKEGEEKGKEKEEEEEEEKGKIMNSMKKETKRRRHKNCIVIYICYLNLRIDNF